MDVKLGLYEKAYDFFLFLLGYSSKDENGVATEERSDSRLSLKRPAPIDTDFKVQEECRPHISRVAIEDAAEQGLLKGRMDPHLRNIGTTGKVLNMLFKCDREGNIVVR
jgi:hypothetical protein